MNLYLLAQDENNDYNTCDSCIVAAKTSTEARYIHPWGEEIIRDRWESDRWCHYPENVKVTLIGRAEDNIRENSVVSYSFNAG